MADTGRLAFRAEGEFWNAYWAPSLTTMNGAVCLGSLRMSVALDPVLKDGFMRFMQLAFETVVKDATGLRVGHWNAPEAAPERERSGRA